MPFVSLIIPTMRVGGLDFLMDSLARQSFADFELVLVDAFHDRRRDIVAKEARDRFLAVRHVGLNPSPFPICSFSTYSNAGIAASTGEVLLFMVDYSRLPVDLIERHARFHKADTTKRAGLMGPHRYVGFQPAPGFAGYGRDDISRYANDVMTGALDLFMFSAGTAVERPSFPHDADGGVQVPADADPKLRHAAGPIGAEYFHAKNESVRKSRVLEVDGYDTELDGAHLYQDTDFADRLTVKAGVSWTLDPTAIVDIVNPRHVFPFAKRLRPHEDNKAIWERKKAAGYPPSSRRLMLDLKIEEKQAPIQDDPSVGRVAYTLEQSAGIETTAPKMRIAMVYGEFSSYGHGPYTADGIYKTVGLTGSEGSFFNLARTLSERGHEVVVFCDTPGEQDHSTGFKMLPIRTLGAFPQVKGVDAMLAWNEPDYLKYAPAGTLRVCDQQLNDFGYAGSGWYPQAGRWLTPQQNWRGLVDCWVSPSENHAKNVMTTELPGAQFSVIANSVDLDLFGASPKRYPHRAVWCSSPDRGLHHALAMWPVVRQQIPDAELHVFYMLAPWIARARENGDDVGRRARFIENALDRLRGYGVVVHDAVPNVQMARELQASACLVYPCDPVRYTEGFGCSVLDAAAGGCVPIISTADALPEVHGDASIGVIGNPATTRQAWIDAVVAVMRGEIDPTAGERMKRHAQKHSRQVIATKWEQMLSGVLHARRGAGQTQDVSRNDISLR